MNNNRNQIKSFLKKSARLIAVLIIASGISACSSYMDAGPEQTDNEIYGLWTDTLSVKPFGRNVNSLLFRPNGTFLYVVSGLGYYEKQGIGELSFYTEEHGNYIQSARNIYFMSKKSVRWDLALNRPPVSTEVERVIFESCTYEIEEDTLKISYISYPADAPVLTSQKYIRKKQLPD